jgi:hypothetical protein
VVGREKKLRVALAQSRGLGRFPVLALRRGVGGPGISKYNILYKIYYIKEKATNSAYPRKQEIRGDFQ